MFEHSTQIRIHYALVDQMGFVYYGNYAQFFEIGRVESLRSVGITYKEVEEMGIIMPVVEFNCKYLRAVKYDELITVKTTVKELTQSHKVLFYGEVLNEAGEICTSSTITLFFMDKQTMRRTKMPDGMYERLKVFFVS